MNNFSWLEGLRMLYKCRPNIFVFTVIELLKSVIYTPLHFAFGKIVFTIFTKPNVIMKSSFFIILICFVFNQFLSAQIENTMENDNLPYYQIPEAPKKYTAATTASRMIDGLGFRYFWATENLREEDLNFKPNDDARTVFETCDHILGLSEVIVNAIRNKPNTRSSEKPDYSFEEMRNLTLKNLKEASDLLKQSPDKSLEEYKVIFKRGEKTSEYPFWNLINGPIADAIWHVGQVVSFRRSSGNPLHPKVSVFNGKLRE